MQIFLLITKMLCEEHAVSVVAAVHVNRRTLNQKDRAVARGLSQALRLQRIPSHHHKH